MTWFKRHKLVDWLAILGLLIVLIGSSWALIQPGFFWIHDPLHVARMAEMAQALKDAHLPPRWSQNFGYGYGIPLFEFYAPLPYIFGALLLIIGISPEWSFKLLFLLPNIVALVGAYVLGKRIMGRAGGVLLAALFTLAPYRAVNLFVRGAVSESWAMMTFPWIIWGGLEALRGKKQGYLALVLATVVLLLSHNITSLLFLPVVSIFILGWWYLESRFEFKTWKQRLKPVIKLLIAQLLAVGVSSFYVWPALLENKYVSINVTTDEYYNFANHFLYLRQFVTQFWGYGNSVFGPEDGLSFFLGWGLLLGLLLSVVILIAQIVVWIKKRKMPALGWITIWSLSFFCFSIAMTLEKTKQLWDVVPLLAFTQFPWRFLSLATIFGAVTVVLALSLVTFKKVQIAILLTLIGITLNSQSLFFQPREFLPADQETYFTDPSKIRAEMGDTLLEYLPTQLPAHSPPTYELLDISSDSYEVIEDSIQNRVIALNLPQPQTITWQVAAFPGWESSIDGMTVPFTVTETGLMAISVPEGEHEVALVWGYTPIRLISDTITLLSIVLIAFWWFGSRKQNSIKT